MKKTYVSSILFFMQCISANTPQPGQRIWNILVNTEPSEQTVSSKLDDISNDFSGVFTALNVICDELKDQISVVDDIDIIIPDPFDNINSIQSKLEISQSLIEPIDSVIDLLDDCIGTPITQADVGTTGYPITSPGKYFLAENITFSPASATPIIEVDSDDVFFDLGGYTITQGNTQLGVIGVDVLGGNNNIVITNGTIRNTSGNGLNIRSAVTNILVSNINSIEAGVLPSSVVAVDGISFTDTRNGLIENCSASFAEDEGMDFDGCSNMIIRNCTITFNRGDGGLSLGDDNDGLYFENCIINSNEGYGVGINRCDNLIFKSCEFNNNDTYGIGPGANLALDRMNILLLGCNILNNGTNGVILRDTSNRWVVANCTISGNGSDGIDVISAASDNNFFFRNTLIENGGNSIDEIAGATNSYLGNYAFKSSGTNYSPGGSTINSTTVSTTAAFTTQPVFWRNINATT